VLAACGGDDDATGSSDSTAGTATDTPQTTAAAGTGASASPVPASTVPASESASTSGAAMATGTPSSTVFTAADFASLGTCTVLPDLTQGPFPTIDLVERRDITEGKDGLSLRVGIQVVDESCAPISGATVEIWHCDIDGDYSAYADGYTSDDAGPGTTYFRGSQVADADGIVEFLTVYPGWYRGRAVHIHSKVHIDDATVLTTQFLFADELNAQVMATEPYAPFGEPDTPNAADGVTGGTAAEDGLLMTVSDDAAIDGRRALIVVGLDPAGTSQGASGGGPGGGGQGGEPSGGPGGPAPGGSRPVP
jgi:protocatechuate 3,4-dioxygenase beta subunit